MFVYSLTPLTRNAKQDRRVVIKGFDMNRRHFTLFLIAQPAALFVTFMFWQLINEYALFVYPLVIGAFFWLFESRTAGGMHLKQYRAIWDRQTSDTGKFLLCGKPIEPGKTKHRVIKLATVPNTKPTTNELDIRGRWVDPLGGAFEA